MWAEEVTYVMKSYDSTNKVYTATDGQNGVWSLSTSCSTSNQLPADFSQTGASSRGICFSTPSYVTVTSQTSFTNVTKIVVEASSNIGSGTGTLEIKVGTTSLGSKNLSKTNHTTYEFTSATPLSGVITLTANQGKNSVWIGGFKVTNSAGGSTPTLTALSVPTNLSSSNVTTTGATLYWDAVANASSYTVKIGTTEYTGVNNTSYNATGLTAGKQYTWSVKAVGDGVSYSTSDYSANANFTTEAEQGGGDEYIHDVLTNADFTATSTTYKDFANVRKNTAVYAGNSAKNNGIQLRSSNNNSGIVSTTSGGKIKIVSVTWNSNTAKDRTINIYGSNTAYTSAADLYDNKKQGTKLGSIVMGTSTSFTITDDYAYVGIRSNDGSLNIDNIDFAWEEGGDTPGVPQKNLSSIAISGTPQKLTYKDGDTFDPTGLVVIGTYDDNSTGDLTAQASFSYTPSAMTLGTTSVSVTATVSDISSAEYIVSVTVNPNVDYVTLPWEWTGGDKTGLAAIDGVTCFGLGSDYTNNTTNAPYLVKLDGTGDYIMVKTNEDMGVCGIKVKMLGGAETSTISVQGSPDGTDFTTVETLTISGAQNSTHDLSTSSNLGAGYRYVKFLFTKGSNVGVGGISIAKASEITPTKEVSSISVSGTSAEFWKGDAFNHDGITVTAFYDDESEDDVTDAASFSGYDMSVAGNQTVTVTYGGKTDTYEINVQTIANTQETAYTTEEAKNIYKAGKDLNSEVYVKGVISKIYNYTLPTNGQISFYVNEGGDYAETDFEFYSCKNIGGAVFTNLNDIEVGASVIGKGKLTEYNSTIEFAANCVLVSYEAPAAPQMFNITIADIQHGSVSASVEAAKEGVTVTLEVTPDAHYTLDVLAVVDTDENKVSVSNNKFVMPASDVTVSATFRELEKVNVNWYVNGVKKQIDNIYTDEKATAPIVDAIDGYTFVGWTVTAVSEETETKPELVDVKDGYTPTNSTDLYAVYSRTEGEGGEAHDYIITHNVKGFPTAYGNMRSVYIDGQYFYLTDVAYYSQYNTTMQFKKNTGEVYNTTNLASTISKVIIEYKEGSTQGLSVYSGAEYQPITNKITGVVDGNTTTYSVNADFFTLKNETSEPVYVESITVSCGAGNSTTYYATEINTIKELVLDENAESIEEIYDEYDKVIVKRTIKANTWSTLCLPFAMTSDQIATNFGSDAEVKLLTNLTVNGDSYTMHFEDFDEIYAGTPYMIRVNTPVSTITVEGNVEVDTSKDPEDSAENGDNLVTFVGNYAKTLVPENEGNYIISSNKFYYVDSAVTNKGFRGYFNLFSLNEDGESSNKMLSFDFNGTLTGIENVNIEGLDDKIFELQGRRIVRLQKGVNIVNGHKVIR